MTSPGSDSTLLAALCCRLRARAGSGDGLVPPAAILWTDPEAQFAPLVERLGSRLPELFVLGDYDPTRRRGPAIWLRCVVDGAAADSPSPGDPPPILYLGNVGRQDLRAGEACPPEVLPLVELMYRGVFWLQKGGRDWTLTAFLTSKASLGLEVSGDEVTKSALSRSLSALAEVPLDGLKGRRLVAADFDRLLSRDLNRDVLRYLGDPGGSKARMGEEGWGAFVSRSRAELGFDPDREADVAGGAKLGRAQDGWASVWERFLEAPNVFPGIPELLARSRPTAGLSFVRSSWPDLNDEAEAEVRASLDDLGQRSHGEVCETIFRLENEHGERRSWVWARLGRSPMAMVLEPLARLATGVRSVPGGTSLAEVRDHYEERAWVTDWAALEAIAASPMSDEARVGEVVRRLLEPWLDDSARRFQELLANAELPGALRSGVVEGAPEGCVFFVDGLRYDLGRKLAEALEGRGLRVEIQSRWAAIPSVTATAKPAVCPVGDQVYGRTLGPDFGAALRPDGKAANAANLRAAMAARGYQIIGTGSLDLPSGPEARSWLETGEIDTRGHQEGSRLARRLGEELERLVERIQALLDTGWKNVRVVTDHGWLLLPGGLPRVDLPKHLTESRWSRCAVLAGDATPEIPRYPWTWNPVETFATAPGIACFNKSEEYAHGGVSIQECLIPDLMVRRGPEARRTVRIASVAWKRLRCVVETAEAATDVVADLRLGHPAGPSVCVSSKPVEADGTASLLLAGDDHLEADLVVVLLTTSGTVLDQFSTRVGAV